MSAEKSIFILGADATPLRGEQERPRRAGPAWEQGSKGRWGSKKGGAATRRVKGGRWKVKGSDRSDGSGRSDGSFFGRSRARAGGNRQLPTRAENGRF